MYNTQYKHSRYHDKHQTEGLLGPFIAVLVVALVFILGAIGYVMNLVTLISQSDTMAFGVEAVLRIIGVFLIPLGVIMGWFA